MASALAPGNEDHALILQRILFCPAEERTARELRSMDKVEREQVWADMTGHAAAIDYRMRAESSELVEDRMQLLENELLHLGEQESTRTGGAVPTATTMAAGSTISGWHAYQLALEQHSEWVEAQKIKFLRSEDFDAARAAGRMMRYFALKQHLFGTELLGRDITLDDLNEDDKESLKAGGMQFLSKRDHAGRGIFFTRTANYVYKQRENLLRAFFYIGQDAARDEISQKVGYLSVSYNVGGYPPGGYDFELTRNVSQLVKAMPVRFCGIYICFSSSAWKPVADLISHLLSPLLRVRLRSIQGSHQECLYQFCALGIPNHAIPLNDLGENRLQHHHWWIKRQSQAEQAAKAANLANPVTTSTAESMEE